MRYDVILDRLPAGYSMGNAKPEEKYSIIVRGFTSSDDGEPFISCLDGWPTIFLSKLPKDAGIRPTNADWFVCVIRPDKSATIWVKDIQIFTDIRPKRSIKRGEGIYQDDIADISRLKFKGIQIQANEGVAVLMSVGWQKGFYFDFEPIQSARTPRNYDIEVFLGQCYAYLSFQHLFSISETEWENLFAQQWYPFITLKTHTIKTMLKYLRANWQIDELLPRISAELAKSIDQLLERWRLSPFFQPHKDAIEHAVKKHLEGDYISSTSILYPRIEGVIRSCHQQISQYDRAPQGLLVKLVTSDQVVKSNETSLLMPDRFQCYLEKVYFADFKPGQPAPVSRHSIAHGVVRPTDLSLKASVLAILLLDQLFFHLAGCKPNEDVHKELQEHYELHR